MSITNFFRDFASKGTFGFVKSTAEVEAAKATQSRSELRRNIAANKGEIVKSQKSAERNREWDISQQKNINVLKKDVDKIDKKQKSDFMASKSALKNLQGQIDRNEAAAKLATEAISEGIQAEERSAARIAAAMQGALSKAGGSQIESYLSKALQDGRLTLSELTQLCAGTLQFTANGFAQIQGELAINDGDIAELFGRSMSLAKQCEGIDANARNISGLSSTLVDQGVLDSGDQLNNLANGSIFFRGRRLAVDALMLPLVLMKASTIYPRFSRDDEDFGDWIMSDQDAAMVTTTMRVVTEATPAAAEHEEYAFTVNPDTGAFVLATKDANGHWPVGSLAIGRNELGMAPSYSSAIKTLGAYGITSFDKWYTSLVPLFSEKLGSLLGLGDGADFVNSAGSDK